MCFATITLKHQCSCLVDQGECAFHVEQEWLLTIMLKLPFRQLDQPDTQVCAGIECRVGSEIFTEAHMHLLSASTSESDSHRCKSQCNLNTYRWYLLQPCISMPVPTWPSSIPLCMIVTWHFTTLTIGLWTGLLYIIGGGSGGALGAHVPMKPADL